MAIGSGEYGGTRRRLILLLCAAHPRWPQRQKMTSLVTGSVAYTFKKEIGSGVGGGCDRWSMLLGRCDPTFHTDVQSGQLQTISTHTYPPAVSPPCVYASVKLKILPYVNARLPNDKLQLLVWGGLHHPELFSLCVWSLVEIIVMYCVYSLKLTFEYAFNSQRECTILRRGHAVA